MPPPTWAPGPVSSCAQFLEPTNSSIFSSPLFLEEYLAYSSPCTPTLGRVSAALGEEGEVRVSSLYTYSPAPPLCEEGGREGVVLFLVMPGRGREGRDRARRLWAAGRSHRFLVSVLEGQDREVQKEQEQHQDIIITDVEEGEAFSYIHLVSQIQTSSHFFF